MRLIDNVVYYTSGDVCAIINKNLQTLTNWDKYSDQLEEKGEKRLIPKATRINGRRLYTKAQVEEIKVFSANLQRGTMAEFNRTKQGVRGKEIQKRIDIKKNNQKPLTEEEIEAKKVEELRKDLSKINNRGPHSNVGGAVSASQKYNKRT